MTHLKKTIRDVSELLKDTPSNLIATSVRRRWISPCLLSIVVAGFSQVASAALEEVVVTARKTAESLQDTPISVTALSGD